MLRGTGAVAAASESLAGSVTRPGLIGGTLAGAGSASVGPVTNIYLTVEGDLRAKTPEEVIGTLQRLAPLVDGKLAPGW
jgi:formyltetrahydrofolate synthetase